MCDQSPNPKVLLVDTQSNTVEATERNYQCLEKLGDNEQLDVFFLIESNDDLEKLNYLQAPVSVYLKREGIGSELYFLVRAALKHHAIAADYKAELQIAMDTTMQSIMDSGEQATVIHFLRESFACNALPDLAKLLSNTISQYQLSCSIQIRTPTGDLNVSHLEPIPQNDIHILEHFKNEAHIYQFGHRLLLNFGAVALLIKNMPLEDEEKCGRLKDHLALILEGAKARVKQIIAHGKYKQILKESNASLSSIHHMESENKLQTVTIMDELQRNGIEMNLFNYGLTEEQEIVLSNTVNQYFQKMYSAYEAGLLIDKEMKSVIQNINKSIEELASL